MFERWIILPLRWFRSHMRDVIARNQKCKVCGQSDMFEFHVPDGGSSRSISHSRGMP